MWQKIRSFYFGFSNLQLVRRAMKMNRYLKTMFRADTREEDVECAVFKGPDDADVQGVSDLSENSS